MSCMKGTSSPGREKRFCRVSSRNTLQPPQWSHFSPHCSCCHHKTYTWSKGKETAGIACVVSCQLQSGGWRATGENHQEKIRSVILQEWTHLCRWLLIELLNAIFTHYTYKSINTLLTSIQLENKEIYLILAQVQSNLKIASFLFFFPLDPLHFQCRHSLAISEKKLWNTSLYSHQAMCSLVY